MKVLVLGATGLAGQAFVQATRKRQHSVMCAARHGTSLTIDISDGDGLTILLQAAKPDLIVNCAALTDIEACERDPWVGWRTNARPLAIMAEWSRATGGGLIHISTDHFFTTGGAEPHGEMSPVEFVNDYARQKYAGEALALSAPKALVLRTSILGHRRWAQPTFAEWAIDVVEGDRPATLFADAYTSSIDVSTFANATLDLVEKHATGLFNLAASEVYSKEAFVLELARRLNRKLKAVQSGSVGSLNIKRANCLGLDVRKAEALLGYNLPRLAEVVKSLVDEHKRGTT